jgi:GNAT superfamily N-acetyltransferase
MTAIDVEQNADFGLRTGQGVAPPTPEPAPTDGGEAVFGAAFRQSNSVVSALHYMRNSGSYTPVPDYNPVEDIKGWRNPSYMLEHGDKFVGSQSPAETYAIKDQIDQEEADRKTLAANGTIGFIAQTMAGALDPTMLLPGGVAIDAAKGGLTFTKAAVELGKAGFMQTVAQEALLHGTQQTRTFEESALNVASGTLLTALIGGGAAALLRPEERAAVEAAMVRDRADMNAHAGNPGTGEAVVVTSQSPKYTQDDLLEAHQIYKEAYWRTQQPETNPSHERFADQARARLGEIAADQTPDKSAIVPGARARISQFGDTVRDTFELPIKDAGGKEVGSIEYIKGHDNDPNAITIRAAGIVDAEARGKGLGTDAYKEIVDFAQSKGMDVYSSGSTNDLSNKVYERLRQQGYAVSKEGETYKIPAPAAPAPKPAGTGMALAAGAAASDTRQLELVPFGLNQIPGVARVVEKTSPMQRVFGADSPTARRAGADLAETSLLFKENLEGKPTVAGGGPALDREARLMIHQGQVASGDDLSRLFSDYRYGEQKFAPRTRALFETATGRADGKMSFSEFKEAVSDALRNGDQHEIPQVQQAAQLIRQKIFDPLKERAIAAGLLPEGVDVKTADSYLQRLYNKQAIAAKRPEFVNRVTDWLQADQQAKAEAQTKIGAYHGAMQSHAATIDKLQSKIAKLETDTDVIAARQEETTRFNKAANQRATKLRTGAPDQENLPLKNAQGGAVFETLARNRGNLLADRASAKLAEIETLEQKLATETANHDKMRGKIEEEIGRWEGKSTKEAQAALKAREQAETARAAAVADGTSKSKGERLASADKAVDRAVARILESDRDMPRQELESRAQEITDRIIGAPDGRLPYDLGMEHGTAFGGSGEAPRGALAAREFNIPDATIRDFLENDIEHIVATHLKTMVPDVLLTEKFGDTKMTETFRKINDEYAALVQAAKSEKERGRFEKERQGVIDDLAAIRDRIRGTYGISSDLPMRNTARALNVLKNYNVLTSMGSAALSSLPDMAGSVLRHGLTSTFSDAWVPFFNMLTRQSDVWQAAAREYRAMGIAVESVLASRHHALTDTLDTYHPQSRVERTMQWATGKFQFVNMLAPWTDFAKINASMVSGSEILRAVKASADGKATARQLRNLGESSIEPHMAARIAKAFETGGEIRDGVHLPNTADWADKEARRVFEGAVARDADIAVVTPGQEKPLWMSHPILGVIGQFKSFTAAATERVLISNLQRRDAQVLQGMLFSMGLGMLSYKINSLTGGQPTSDKPQDWIKESISRGNLLGWFEEGNALASKATRGGVDIYRMIGADKPLSRYASRSAMDQILGPTAGKIGGIIQGVQAASHPSEWNEGDSKAIRRLVAGQNTFYLRRLFDQVEASGNSAFGIPMKAKPENR